MGCFLAIIPALILIWIWIWGADFRFRDDYPLRPVSARWLATLGLFLIVIAGWDILPGGVSASWKN